MNVKLIPQHCALRSHGDAGLRYATIVSAVPDGIEVVRSVMHKWQGECVANHVSVYGYVGVRDNQATNSTGGKELR